MFRLSIAAEFIEQVVDEYDGSVKIGKILIKMSEVPKYQKMRERKLHSLVIAAAKKSKSLGFIRYYRKSGNKDVIVYRVVVPHNGAEV
jgi:hypothetical protein